MLRANTPDPTNTPTGLDKQVADWERELNSPHGAPKGHRHEIQDELQGIKALLTEDLSTAVKNVFWRIGQITSALTDRNTRLQMEVKGLKLTLEATKKLREEIHKLREEVEGLKGVQEVNTNLTRRIQSQAAIIGGLKMQLAANQPEETRTAIRNAKVELCHNILRRMDRNQVDYNDLSRRIVLRMFRRIKRRFLDRGGE